MRPRNPGYKKPFLFVVFLFIGTSSSWGQYSLGLLLNKPSMDFGSVFKPRVSLELGYHSSGESSFESQLDWGASVSYYALRPWADTLFYTMEHTDVQNETTLRPGFQVWDKFKTVSIAMFCDYHILDKVVSPTIGFEGVANATSFSMYDMAEGVHEINYKGGSLQLGIMPRIGVVAKFAERYMLYMNMGKSFMYDSELGTLSYWKVRTGLAYKFNN